MGRLGHLATVYRRTADLRTKILDLRGFYSSKILILMGGIPRPIGNSPEIMSQDVGT